MCHDDNNNNNNNYYYYNYGRVGNTKKYIIIMIVTQDPVNNSILGLHIIQISPQSDIIQIKHMKLISFVNGADRVRGKEEGANDHYNC